MSNVKSNQWGNKHFGTINNNKKNKSIARVRLDETPGKQKRNHKN